MMNNSKSKFIFILAICTIFISSCDKGVVYNHTEKIDNETWNFEDDLIYELDVKDTSEYYELVANINFNVEFSYENFYTKIITEFPSGTNAEDLVSFQLANNQGSWIAKCSSKSCSSELVLQDRFRFREIGKHVLKLKNHSREILNGISSVELKLYDTSKM